MNNNYNNEEQILLSSEKSKKPNKIQLITFIRVLWLVSFISWCYFTFFITNSPSQKGMWISLTFMWIFVILQRVFNKK